MTYLVLSFTVLDARDCRGLAEFHREPFFVMGNPEGHPFCLLVG